MIGNVVLRQPKQEQNNKNEWRRSFQNRVSLWEQKSNDSNSEEVPLVKRPYSLVQVSLSLNHYKPII